MINNFVSNRTNLTILQCILYFMIGWIMGEYLTWTKLMIMFIILLGIQMITHIKAVSDGIAIVLIILYVLVVPDVGSS